ncbi:MAG: ATP-binding protein [Ruminococcus sp.]|nr:ATP-binding protein [Ruminococcus sp.]
MAEVILLCGKICSGKSFYSSELKNKRNCVLLSCDEITIPLEKYLCGDFDEMAQILKSYLREKACEIISTGADVIIDFGQWKKSERQEMREFFSQRNIKTELHYIKVSDEIWEKHIEKRNREVQLGRKDAYFVDEGLKSKVLSQFEEPSDDEIDVLIEITQ